MFLCMHVITLRLTKGVCGHACVRACARIVRHQFASPARLLPPPEAQHPVPAHHSYLAQVNLPQSLLASVRLLLWVLKCPSREARALIQELWDADDARAPDLVRRLFAIAWDECHRAPVYDLVNGPHTDRLDDERDMLVAVLRHARPAVVLASGGLVAWLMLQGFCGPLTIEQRTQLAHQNIHSSSLGGYPLEVH